MPATASWRQTLIRATWAWGKWVLIVMAFSGFGVIFGLAVAGAGRFNPDALLQEGRAILALLVASYFGALVLTALSGLEGRRASRRILGWVLAGTTTGVLTGSLDAIVEDAPGEVSVVVWLAISVVGALAGWFYGVLEKEIF